MLSFTALLKIFSKFCCLEVINFSNIFQPSWEQSFQLPAFRTYLSNNLTFPLVSNRILTRNIRICNSCSGQMYNHDMNQFNLSGIINTIKFSSYSKKPTFRIFVDFHQNHRLNHTINVDEAILPIDILVHFQNNILQSVFILKANTFIALSHPGYNIAPTLHVLLLNSNKFFGRFDLQNEFIGHAVHIVIIGSEIFRLKRSLAESYCSNSRLAFQPRFNVFQAIDNKLCLILHFLSKSNVTLISYDSRKKQLGLLYFRELSSTYHYVLDNELSLGSINIFPYGASHDGLVYYVFVNKAKLIKIMKLSKPFDIYVWISFFLRGVLLSIIVCKSLKKDFSQLWSILIWIFSIVLGQKNEIMENQLRTLVRFGSFIIAMWSGMGIILSCSYAKILYLLLISDPKIKLPNNLVELVRTPDIKLYSFETPTYVWNVGKCLVSRTT